MFKGKKITWDSSEAKNKLWKIYNTMRSLENFSFGTDLLMNGFLWATLLEETFDKLIYIPNPHVSRTAIWLNWELILRFAIFFPDHITEYLLLLIKVQIRVKLLTNLSNSVEISLQYKSFTSNCKCATPNVMIKVKSMKREMCRIWPKCKYTASWMSP